MAVSEGGHVGRHRPRRAHGGADRHQRPSRPTGVVIHKHRMPRRRPRYTGGPSGNGRLPRQRGGPRRQPLAYAHTIPGVKQALTPRQKRRAKAIRVANAQAELKRAFQHAPRKKPPFTFGLTPLGGSRGARTARHMQAQVQSQMRRNHTVYDDKTGALYEYHPPNKNAVAKSVTRLFKGSHEQRFRALKELQRMGVVSGGQPDAKVFKYLGTNPGAIKPPPPKVEHPGFFSRHGRGGIVKIAKAVAGTAGDALTGNDRLMTASILPEPTARRVRKSIAQGILSGSEAALGAVGDVLDRPLAAVESGAGKALVKTGVIKDTQLRNRIMRARGPGTAFLKGRGRRGGVSGGDIAQGLGLPRQVGLAIDLTTDPLMWIGLAGVPETAGASSLVVAERIAAKLGPEALKTAKIVKLADEAQRTRRFDALEAALRDVAKTNNIRIPHDIVNTHFGRKVLREVKRTRTSQVIESVKGQKGVQVVERRGLVRTALRRPAKRSRLVAVGKPGQEAVTAIAHSVKEGQLAPGFRFSLAYPTGRKFGHPIDVKLPKGTPVPMVSPSIRADRIKRDVQRIEADFELSRREATKGLRTMQDGARNIGDTERYNELDHAINEIERKLAAEKRVAISKVQERSRFQLQQPLGDVFDRANAKRLQRQTASFANEFGRNVQSRLMKAALEGMGPAGRDPKRVAESLARVQLHLWAREGAGKAGRAALNAAMPLDKNERQVMANLIRVYKEMLRQGQDLGIIGRGVKEYGGPRIWAFDSQDIRNTDQVREIVQNMSQRLGSNSFFQHHRTAPSVFDLADPDKLAHVIQQYAKKDISPDEARNIADTLWTAGKFKLRSELAARKLERGEQIVFDQQTPEMRHAIRTATGLTPKGSDREVPLFNVAEGGPQEGFVTLNPAAERHYGFSTDALAGLTDREARMAKLYSALSDRERVQQLLKPMRAQKSMEADSLRAELRDIEEQIKKYDMPASAAPPEQRATLLDKYGVENKTTRYVKVSKTEADAAATEMLNTISEGLDKLNKRVYSIAKVKPGGRAFRQHHQELAKELDQHNKNFDRLAPQIRKAIDKQQVQRQVGSKRLPANLKMSTVINDSGVMFVKGAKDVKAPPGLPVPRFRGEDGPFDDPFDYTHHLPDMREQNYMPILDPRMSNFYRTRAQGVVSAFHARWAAIDAAEGRSTREADSGRYIANGQEGRARNLKPVDWDTEGNPTQFLDREFGTTVTIDEASFPSPTLLANKDRSLYYDPVTKQEFAVPDLGSGRLSGVGIDRVWPTHIIADARSELLRGGEYNIVFETGMESAWGRLLSQFRFGVTTPFPAYHVRNMVSDLLKSLQADSGVMFHPIANAKLVMAAFGKRKNMLLDIPGHGKMSVEDFLLVADTFGLTSGHHVAEVYRLIDRGHFTEDRASAFLHGINPISPNSWFGAKATSFGVGREDVTRFMTFMQRMRTNGGDAADAAMYMIRHHFNYNDLSAIEKRVARNVFLFYTWYRKNIPLQLTELVRRPGFFAGVAHTYRALELGETPINQDWSKINPIFPDMSGPMPVSGAIPDYYRDRLMGVGVNWNGHAALFGFGAPWADLELLSWQGKNDILAMTNPILGAIFETITRKDLLTGRPLRDAEPSGFASFLDSIGIKLPHDKKGRPILPFWANVLTNRIPIMGRAGGAFIGTGPFRDQGRAQIWGKRLSPLLGLNVYIGPEPGGKRERAAITQLVLARAMERRDLQNNVSNLPKAEREKRLKEFDKETKLWAKEHHVSKSYLESVKNSGFYKSEDMRGEGVDTIKLGTGQDTGGGPDKINLGGSKHGGKGGPQGGVNLGGANNTDKTYNGTVLGGSGGGGSSYGGGGGGAFSAGAGGTYDGNIPQGQKLSIVEDAARKAGIDPAVLVGVWGAESNFGANHNDSRAGAQGDFQFMPGTAASMHINPHNFRQAAYAAARYLAQYKGRGVDGMLAAYNAGPAGNPHNSETIQYVQRVKAIARKHRGGGLRSAGADSGGGVKAAGVSVSGGRGKIVPPSVTQTADKTDVDAALIDSLLRHDKHKSLLKDLMWRLDSGQYTIPGETKIKGGSVPKLPNQGADSVNLGNPKGGRRGKVKVSAGANRAGVPIHTPVLDFLSQVAGFLGQTIVVGTGSHHNQYTTSGNVSDHWAGWAADIPASGSGGDRIAGAALMMAGVSRAQARKMAQHGGLFNINHGGYRIQIIWKTMEGGNHYNHVHVGLKKL